MEAGFRIHVDQRKEHPMDFALWKGAKAGEPSWPSPGETAGQQTPELNEADNHLPLQADGVVDAAD